MEKNKGGRPKSAPETHHLKTVTVRFTDLEHEKLLAQARISTLSLAEFCRKRLVDNQLTFHATVAPDAMWRLGQREINQFLQKMLTQLELVDAENAAEYAENIIGALNDFTALAMKYTSS